jgi:hypothetical protein
VVSIAVSKVIPLIYPSLPFLVVLDKSFMKNKGAAGPEGREYRKAPNIFNQKTIVLIRE